MGAMSTWRTDPALASRFHASFPDDLQVLVHDGEPRRTQRRPELCWVRVIGRDDGPARPGAQVDDRAVYRAQLLNQPHALTSVRQGDTLRFYAAAGAKHPLTVSEAYLAERAAWRIGACACGLYEGLDPPSTMWRTRFPDVDAVAVAFSAFCPLCGGTQMLERVDGQRP